MSKKLLIGILLGALLVSVLPMVASAQITAAPEDCTIRSAQTVASYITACDGAPDPCPLDSSDYPCALCCTFGTVFFVTDLIFVVLMVLVMIFVLLGAFYILTAGGEPDKVNKGRDFILYALIGFALALLARGVPMIITFLIGV